MKKDNNIVRLIDIDKWIYKRMPIDEKLSSVYRYYLLTAPKASYNGDDANQYRYVEGVLRRDFRNQSNLIWQPINLFSGPPFESKIITEEDLLSLLRSGGIVPVNIEKYDLSQIKNIIITWDEEIISNVYQRYYIPALIINDWKYTTFYRVCSDFEFSEKMKGYIEC